MGSGTGAIRPSSPNSIRIRGPGRQSARRRTPVRTPTRRLTCLSSRPINKAERGANEDLARASGPSAHVDRLPRDEARVVAAEKGDDRGDVLRLAHTPQWDLRRRADLERLEVDPHP